MRSILLGTLVLVLAIMAPRPAPSAIPDEGLEVIVARWEPSDDPLTLDGVRLTQDHSRTIGLLESDIALMQQHQLGGRFTEIQRLSFGTSSGTRSTAIILMRRQLTPGKTAVALPQPAGMRVVYVQGAEGDDGWMVFPPNNTTPERRLHLAIEAANPSRTMLAVDWNAGSSVPKAIFSWEPQSAT